MRQIGDAFPIILNSGRIRDQWHTMTRTGRAGRLFAHLSEPFAALHPKDIERYRLQEGGFVRLTSRVGDALVRVTCDTGQRPGTAFMPMHWTDQFSRRARVMPWCRHVWIRIPASRRSSIRRLTSATGNPAGMAGCSRRRPHPPWSTGPEFPSMHFCRRARYSAIGWPAMRT